MPPLQWLPDISDLIHPKPKPLSPQSLLDHWVSPSWLTATPSLVKRKLWSLPWVLSFSHIQSIILFTLPLKYLQNPLFTTSTANTLPQATITCLRCELPPNWSSCFCHCPPTIYCQHNNQNNPSGCDPSSGWKQRPNDGPTWIHLLLLCPSLTHSLYSAGLWLFLRQARHMPALAI